jgi:hypothetical protein
MEPGFECGQLIPAGLDEEHGFGGRLNFALPEIDGLDGGNLCDAGGEALLDQRKGEPASSELATVVRMMRAGGLISVMGTSSLEINSQTTVVRKRLRSLTSSG